MSELKLELTEAERDEARRVLAKWRRTYDDDSVAHILLGWLGGSAATSAADKEPVPRSDAALWVVFREERDAR